MEAWLTSDNRVSRAHLVDKDYIMLDNEKRAMTSGSEVNPPADYGKYLAFEGKYGNLWMLLFLTSAAIVRAMSRETSEAGIRYREFAVLRVVDYLGDSATSANISRCM
ncbi:MAG: hypothetical protein NTU41_13915, partial [Chloroflexi bacterium]|nr:hypothetical protein [Chloroflexota bacterium]